MRYTLVREENEFDTCHTVCLPGRLYMLLLVFVSEVGA